MSARLLILVVAMLAGTLPATSMAMQGELKNADRVMWQYAQCLVRKNGKISRTVFAHLPQSSEANAILESLQRPSCLPNKASQLRFDHTIIRGAMAEHLYKRKDKEKNLLSVYDGDADIKFGSFEQRYDFVFIRACECALEDAYELGEKVLASKVGSPKERSAMSQLAPELSPCLDEGVEIDLTPAMFRSYIAEAALRRAIGSKAKSQSKGEPDA